MTKNKRPKRELAKKMMTHKEIKKNITPFNCDVLIHKRHINLNRSFLI